MNEVKLFESVLRETKETEWFGVYFNAMGDGRQDGYTDYLLPELAERFRYSDDENDDAPMRFMNYLKKQGLSWDPEAVLFVSNRAGTQSDKVRDDYDSIVGVKNARKRGIHPLQVRTRLASVFNKETMATFGKYVNEGY